MKLVLEQTQQGSSYEVSVSAEGVEELKRKVKIKGEKKEAILTLRQKPSQYISCLELQRRLLTLKTNIMNPRLHAFLSTFSLELDGIEKVAVGSSLRSLKLKRTIESRANRVMRTASAAAKPCQGDSSEFYLITGNFLTRRSIKLISYKVLKLKNIKKDGYTCFQHQEQYEHDGPVVTRSQEGQRSQDDDKRLCLVDDLKDTSSSLKSMITTTFHKLKIEVKDYELKTIVKA
ncbi:hypothetical protein Tco_0563683 [Tanacetum coccineum]